MLHFKGIVTFMRWYQISTQYQLLRKFGYRYWEGKNSIGTSLPVTQS